MDKSYQNTISIPKRKNFYGVSLPIIFLKRRFWLIVSIIIAVALIFLWGSTLFKNSTVSTSSTSKVAIQPPTKTMDLNREFSFPLKDDKGAEISKIKVTFQSAEIRDEIVIKQQKAAAIKGKAFLVLNIKIQNESDKAIEINTKNYIRLSVNNNQEWLAPEIHNDPVSVQPISTKLTRLGFVIAESDKNLKLRIGEINGPKTTIDLNP